MTTKPYPFTPEQEAWLRDLETTEAPQTKGFLRVRQGGKYFPEGYCCLGRACIVFGLEELDDGDGLSSFLGENVGLPRTITNLLRLYGDCGEFETLVDIGDAESGSTFHNLADFNDAGWSFKQIAAYIRANPENVFLPPEEDKE